MSVVVSCLKCVCALGLATILVPGLVAASALAGEEGLPGKESAPPPAPDSREDASPLLYDFNDLQSGAVVPWDVYGDAGILIGTGPFGSAEGVVMTSRWSPSLQAAGPCDGSLALRTDPFNGPTIKFEILEGTTEVSVDVGDYGPSDDDEIDVCAYADLEATERIGCARGTLPYNHETECLALSFVSDSQVIRSVVVMSRSSHAYGTNTVFVDNLFVHGTCLDPEVEPLFQHDPPWGTLPHTGTDGDLAHYGAEVTTLAMLLNSAGESAGFSITPGELESWLAAEHDGFLGPLVNPFAVGRLARLSGLDLAYHGLSRDTKPTSLAHFLCRQGLPGVVLLDTAEGPAGDHMVLATGREQRGDEDLWHIADPSGRADRLGEGPYPESFDLHMSFRPDAAAGAFAVVTGGVDRLLLVNPQGGRSGYDEQTGQELNEVFGVEHVWRALSDARRPDPVEAWPMLQVEHFAPEPGRYCIKPQADAETSAVARFLAYDGLGFGQIQEFPFEEGPQVRPTFVVEIPEGSGAAPDVALHPNRAPESSAAEVPDYECASHAGTVVGLNVSSWEEPDCDRVTHTWTGPFPDGGGSLEGETVHVTMPLGEHEVTLVTDDGLLSSEPSRRGVSVFDSRAPFGRITFPEDGLCYAESVTIEDDFSDVCDASPQRRYEPGPGPTYEAEGAHKVFVEVADASGNASHAEIAFVVDKQAPVVALGEAPQMEQEVPRLEPVARYVSAHDDDAAPGPPVHERILIDGCVVLDGETYGDQDGRLLDEHVRVTAPLLCLAYTACGQTEFDDALFVFEAEDCAGNIGSDGDVVRGHYTMDELGCE